MHDVESLQKGELARQVSHAEHWTSSVSQRFKDLKRQRIQTAGSHSCWQLAAQSRQRRLRGSWCCGHGVASNKLCRY